MRNPIDSQLVLRPHSHNMIPPYLPKPQMVTEEMDINEFHLSQVGRAEQACANDKGAGSKGSRAVSRLGSALGGVGIRVDNVRSIDSYFFPSGAGQSSDPVSGVTDILPLGSVPGVDASSLMTRLFIQLSLMGVVLTRVYR